MKLRDRIAAWFGYVPAERLAEATRRRITRPAHDPILCAQLGGSCGQPSTITTVKPRSEIIVSADFKRGIPCS